MGVRDAAKRLRARPAINHAVTAAVRRGLGGRPAPRWALEHLPRTGVVEIDVPGAGAIRLHSGQDWATSRMWWSGIDGGEPTVMPWFRRAVVGARAVLDIGAYVGHYALVAARSSPGARVFAFEPVRAVAANLGANLALNPTAPVTLLPHVVGRDRGLAHLHVGAPGLPSSSSVLPAWAGAYRTDEVARIDIDSFCDEWRVEGVDVVKMDVEGAEPDVIAGMARTLERDRPTIFSEVHRLGDSAAYGELGESLAALGYRLFAMDHEGPRPIGRLEDRGRTWNALALPDERVATLLRS